MRLFRYAKHRHDQGVPMPIMAAVVLSTLLLAVAGCAFSSDPSTAKQEPGKKESTKKPIKRDQERSMNEESMEAVR
jgi:Flp pilus assembly protein TadD